MHIHKEEDLITVKCITSWLQAEVAFVRLVRALGDGITHLGWRIRNLELDTRFENHLA